MFISIRCAGHNPTQGKAFPLSRKLFRRFITLWHCGLAGGACRRPYTQGRQPLPIRGSLFIRPLWIGEKLSTGIEKIVMLTTGGAKFFPQSVWKKAFDLADPRKTGSFSPEVAVEKTVDTVDNSCAEVCAYWGWTSIMSTFSPQAPAFFRSLPLLLSRALV